MNRVDEDDLIAVLWDRDSLTFWLFLLILMEMYWLGGLV